MFQELGSYDNVDAAGSLPMQTLQLSDINREPRRPRPKLHRLSPLRKKCYCMLVLASCKKYLSTLSTYVHHRLHLAHPPNGTRNLQRLLSARPSPLHPKRDCSLNPLSPQASSLASVTTTPFSRTHNTSSRQRNRLAHSTVQLTL